MKITILNLLLLVGCLLCGQVDTTLFYGVNGRLCESGDCQIKTTVEYNGQKTIKLKEFVRNESDWLQIAEENWKLLKPNIYKIKTEINGMKIGFVRTFVEAGNGILQFIDKKDNRIIREGYSMTRVPLHLTGELVEYYENGMKKSVSEYKNNELVSNKNWFENGIPYFDDLFYTVDTYPSYSEGNDYLNSVVMEKLKLNKVDFSELNGRLVIGFVVFEDGSIGGFRIIKGLSEQVEQIVVNALRNLPGTWTPAELNGKKVRFFQTYPVNFVHDEFQVEFFDYSSGLVQFEHK